MSSIAETPVAGPGLLVDNGVTHWLLARRNDESLYRLASIAEARGGGSRARPGLIRTRVATVPVVLLFLEAQRYVVDGIATTGSR